MAAMIPMVQIENNTRRRFLFDSYARATRPDGSKGALERDKARSFVLGDAADRVLPPGAVRGPKCPSPVVRLPLDLYDSLDEQVHRVLDALDRAGHITVTDVKVDESGETHKRPAGVSLRDRVRAWAGADKPAPAEKPAAPSQPASSGSDKGGRR